NVANGWYLSGWCPQFESGCIFVPRQGEPMILGGPESEPFAKTDSSIKKTRNIPVFMVPGEEYPNARISSFAEVFEEAGLQGKNERIGVVGFAKMPLAVHERLQEELKSVELVDITSEYEYFRVIKSPWEQEQIRRAFALASEAFQAMEPLIQAGTKEVEVAAAGEGKARSLGANWFAFQTIVASSERTNAVVPTASEKELQTGETVMFGLSPRSNGYAGVFGYTTVVGEKPNEAQHRCLQDLREAYRITRDHLQPGMRGKDLDAITREFLVQRGYEKYLVCPFVHTIGLMEAEGPFFGPHSDEVLQPGMMVCIDVSVFGVPEVHGVRFESGYLITEWGAEPLSPFMEGKILA
ncbi:MAG: Xaa-Pro peptidase family protein, partial [Atribacterota bacterium]|nr:Xaa-Pro peptidase family protein [Atribacterota bacterium]